MTKKPKSGTLGTRGAADKKGSKSAKDTDVVARMIGLLGLNRVRIHPHANQRMSARNVIYYEVLQALSVGKHVPSKDRFSVDHNSWEYCIEGKTLDKRLLRLGISFEMDNKTQDRLLVITVIDPAV